MISREKINQLTIEAYENAKSKGFHDREEEPEERVALLHSEISEALEDFRKHKMALEIMESGKPIGFPSEIADIAIRLFDLFGKHNQKFNLLALNGEYGIDREYFSNRSIPWWIHEFHHSLNSSLDTFRDERYNFTCLDVLLCKILLFCEFYDIDIEKAIEVKMFFNKGREFMHGGKAC